MAVVANIVVTPPYGYSPLPVVLDASGSTGTSLIYTWSVTAFGLTLTGGGVTAPTTFSIAGTYLIELSVTDGVDTDTASTSVTVLPALGQRHGWRFTDPVTDEVYLMEVNPKEDTGSHAIERQTKYEAAASTYKSNGSFKVDRTVAAGAGTDMQTFSYSGIIYTQEQFLALSTWFNKDYSWRLRDDLGREFLIYVDKFTVERVRSQKFRWKHSYQFSGIILEEI